MRKTTTTLTAFILAASLLSACTGDSGAKDSSEPSSGSVPATEGSTEDSAAVSSPAEEELPNWKGVVDYAFVDIGVYTVGDETKGGQANILIAYPSMKPSSYGFAYQWDACFVLVSGCGKVKKEQEVKIGDTLTTAEFTYNATLDRLEDAFEVNRDALIQQIERDRHGMTYGDFDFTVESQELLTINDLSVCKYSGTHTYTVKNESGGLDKRESAFVTYAVDTRQLDGYVSPFMITIINDTIENPSMDPLPEGLIDKYGVKMIESILLMHSWEMDYEAKPPAEFDYDAKNPLHSRSSSSSQPAAQDSD